ncbi:MAG: carboxypeptidase regulatory-like domain-containing protein [Armatimonadetes bacterium]|nr:carboxypeptidase regulatory-like domain-containing protein [Armatimonadota bacterium]
MKVARGPSSVGRAATTGEDGAFRLAELAAGDGYVLTATKEGFVAQTREGIRVVAGQVTRVEFVLRAAETPVGYGVIEGEVVDGEGRPLGGVLVAIVAGPSGVGRQATTGERGGFRFGELSPGRYALKATREGHGAAAQDGIVVEAGRTTPVRFVLRRAVAQ